LAKASTTSSPNRSTCIPSTGRRAEQSRQNFSLTTLQRLATALDTKLAYSFQPNEADEPTRVVVT